LGTVSHAANSTVGLEAPLKCWYTSLNRTPVYGKIQQNWKGGLALIFYNAQPNDKTAKLTSNPKKNNYKIGYFLF
jgi:hypothetical protein